jgi:hypothetical protein
LIYGQPVDEMKIFFHQTLVAMSDTFHRATGDDGRDHERFFANILLN